MLKRLQKRFPGTRIELQPGSGGFSRKGDIQFDDWIIEAKTTDANSFRLTANTLDKARADAVAHGKTPLMCIQLGDGRSYWVVEDNLMMELMTADEMS